MEYLVFRTLRMIEREISLYKDLYACMCNQQKVIMQSDILDLLVGMVEQKELTAEITMVENEIMDELKELAVLLGMDIPAGTELTINEVVNSLQENYTELAEMIKTRCWILAILVKKTGGLLTENMDSFRNCLEVWRSHPPVFELWNEVDGYYDGNEDFIEVNQSFFKKERITEDVYTNLWTQ